MEYKKHLNSVISCLFIILSVFIFKILFNKLFPDSINANVENLIPNNEIIREWTTKTFKSTRSTSNRNCTVSKCINLHRCVLELERKLTIALQPILQLVDAEKFIVTPEYLELRRVICESRYYISDPSLACLLLPGIDTFSFFSGESTAFSDLLELARKNDVAGSSNFLIFNFQAQKSLKTFFDPSISASANFRHHEFRRQFDIAIPIFRPVNNLALDDDNLSPSPFDVYKLINVDANFVAANILKIAIILHSFSRVLSDELRLQESQLLNSFENFQTSFNNKRKMEIKKLFLCENYFSQMNTLPVCDESMALVPYNKIVSSDFDVVIIMDSVPLFEAILMDVLQGGRSIPIIISDDYILPFSEVIDWNAISLHFFVGFIPEIPKILSQISIENFHKMRLQANKIYARYFSSFSQIVLNTLEILEVRLVSGSNIRHKEYWNLLAPTHQPTYCSFEDNNIEFIAKRETTEINIVIIFEQPIKNVKEGEIISTKLINSLLIGIESFDVKTVTVIWNSIDNENLERATFDGVRRTMHPLEISLLEVKNSASINNFWNSDYFAQQFSYDPQSDEGFIVINGENHEVVLNLFDNGFANSGFQLWHSRPLSTIVFENDADSIVHPRYFPTFGIASMYNIKVLQDLAKAIVAESLMINQNDKLSDFEKPMFRNCFHLALNGTTFEYSFRRAFHRFKLCHC